MWASDGKITYNTYITVLIHIIYLYEKCIREKEKGGRVEKANRVL